MDDRAAFAFFIFCVALGAFTVWAWCQGDDSLVKRTKDSDDV